MPQGIVQSNQANLLVAESGTTVPNTGRISIVDRRGNRRTLIDGLPAGLNDVNEPSGPARLFMRGRTLYVTIAVGDVGISGGAPGTVLPNPNPVSSPLFSSVLAIHLSAHAEKITSGFSLSLDDQQALASGQKLTLSNRAGDKLTIERVADFPNYVANPLPTFPDNVQLSNPFGLVAVGDQLYVTDGGRNLVWRVDIPSGSSSILTQFAPLSNPMFPALGPPVTDAVPTGIVLADRELLVALFGGFPFAPTESLVSQVDPQTGAQSPFITGLQSAIDVIPLKTAGNTDYLVLQHASVGPFFGSPGLILRFDTPSSAPAVVSNCLTRPTDMEIDRKTGTLFATEYGGRVVTIPFAP